MAWIEVTDEADATGDLKAAYERVTSTRGAVANILKVHSVAPKAMTTHLELYRHLMYAPSELSRRQREEIAVAVSATNACHY